MKARRTQSAHGPSARRGRARDGDDDDDAGDDDGDVERGKQLMRANGTTQKTSRRRKCSKLLTLMTCNACALSSVALVGVIIVLVLVNYEKLTHPETYKMFDSARGVFEWNVEERLSLLRGFKSEYAAPARERDVYGLRRVDAMCASGVEWALNPASGYESVNALCEDLRALPSALKLFSLRLSLTTRFKYWLAEFVPHFNRGYGVETFLANQIARGVFTATKIKDATAIFVPVRPYLQRILTLESYAPRDPLRGTNKNFEVRESIRRALGRDIEWIKRTQPNEWNAKGKCGRVILTNIDIGLSAFDKSDVEIRNDAVVIVGNSEVPAERAEDIANEGRQQSAIEAGYNPLKDVAIWFGMSAYLPRAAVELGALRPEKTRQIELSFRGSMLRGAVRQAVMPKLIKIGDSLTGNRVWDLKAQGQEKPKDYMNLLASSKYCLYLYGDRAHTSRLYDVVTFGCVPVVVADNYELPFSWLLDWSKFSISVKERDVDRMGEILSAADHASLQRELFKVHSFLQYHESPIFGDAFWITMLGVRRQLDRCALAKQQIT